MKEEEGVGEAVVMLREGGEGEKRLVGYYTVKREEREKRRGGCGEDEEARSEKLPRYMVPGVCGMEEMPLTVNGKVDRRRCRRR